MRFAKDIEKVCAASFLSIGILSLTQPARAIIRYDWQFTNTHGNVGAPVDVVEGFVEFNNFNSFDEIAGQNNIAADNFQLTTLNYSPGIPFLGDGEVELDINLLEASDLNTNSNSFDFDAMGEANSLVISVCSIDGCGSSSNFELLRFNSDIGKVGPIINPNFATFSIGEGIAYESDGTFEISQSSAVSVPFECSPNLAIFLLGGLFAFRSYFKRR